ncbi:cytochrome c [Pontibacterium granulatum]|uniref:c-type cytochrome n=1 Tax=Pontibacterium granulatum TaxID=2036029 RepID=UPI00249AF44B|nr:cytochrome c [Pontibacterium granulatum]MDI3325821.1 cytochrome c [Pontibacterium granulatum]
MNKMIAAVSLVLMASVSSQLVMAHGGATGIVKERMDLMDNMKDAVKQLKAIYKGDEEYDPDTIRNAALVIRDHSGDAMSKLFPEGSLKGKSEAKPIIWQEWNRFKKLADDQEKIAQGLYNAAENQGTASGGGMMGTNTMMGQNMMDSHSMMGSGSMMGNSKHMQQNMTNPEHLGSMPSDMVFKMLTDTCSSCHTRYRKEKDK